MRAGNAQFDLQLCQQVFYKVYRIRHWRRQTGESGSNFSQLQYNP